MKKIIAIFFCIFFIKSTEAAIKERIIINLEKINNLSFNFKQTINNKWKRWFCWKIPRKHFLGNIN
jgi:hypothetical protein